MELKTLSFHLVYPGVFLLAIKLGLRQPLRLLLQHLQGVQQLLQGGLILPPTGHGSVPWLLRTHCPLKDLLGTSGAVQLPYKWWGSNFSGRLEAYLRTVRRSAVRWSRGEGSEAGQFHYVVYDVQVRICGKNAAAQLSRRFVTQRSSQQHPPVFFALVSVGETRLLMTTGFLGTLLRTMVLPSVLLSCSATALRCASAACWGLLGCICCS